MHTHFPSRNLRAVLMVFSLILFCATVSRAQTPQASVSGIVSDPSGAAVPAVKITVTDTERGVTAVTQTNQTGVYFVKSLIPSTYKITAEASGFRTYVLNSFPLSAKQDAVLNIELAIGKATQTVEVTSQVQMVNPSNATLGGLMQNQQIVELPLVNRNVFTLMALEPGVAPSTPNSYQSTSFTSAVRYSINGGLESTSTFELDGISLLNQSDLPGLYGLTILPSVESIQEFRVQTNSYASTYGRSGGGITTLVTKSGTNQFHGDVFEFLRNDALNSTSFFTNRSHGKKPVTRYDQYGVSIGGPVIKNKTFFFATYERNLSHGGGFSNFTVPTAAERQGDFSQSYNSKGQLQVIYNPFTTRKDPADPTGTTYIRDPFLNNKVPTNLMDPVAVNFMKYWPLPNLPGTAISGTSLYTPVNNLGLSGVVSSPVTELDTRVDHNFGGNKRGFIRYDYLKNISGAINYFKNPADEGYGDFTVDGHNAAIGYTETVGTATVIDLRVGFNRFGAVRPSMGLGFDITSLGFPASVAAYGALGNVPMFPAVSVQNYAMLGNASGPYYVSHNYDWIFSGSWARVIGKHTLTAGAESTTFFLNFVQTNPLNFSFTNGMTQGPNPLTTGMGNSIASLLMGTGTGGSFSDSPLAANANHYFAEFVQDDFKMTRKLTINLGFRLEQETGTTERHDRMTTIDPTVLNPLSQQVGFKVYGGYVFAGSGTDSIGRRAVIPTEWKPNPRIGLAYLLNDKTTIRAGYGIFYGLTHTGATNAFTGSAFSTATSWLPSLDGINPNGSPQAILSNPFPNGYTYPTGTSLGLLSAVGQALAGAWPQTLRTPYNQQWNFTIQRSLTTNLLLQVAYAGNKGTHLGAFECCGTTPNTNQLPIKNMGEGNSLLTLVTNPFYGYLSPSLSQGQPKIQQQQLERPWPLWTAVEPYNAAIGNSVYHALQMMLQKRFVNGSSFIAGYTWSKMTSDVVDGRWNDATAVFGVGSVQNWYCLACEHGVSSYDVPHRFTFSGVGQLPVGKGRKWGSNMPGVLNQIIGGWQVNAIMTIASGMPLLPRVAQNTTNISGAGQRPNSVPGASQSLGSQRTLYQWFNTAAFSQPANFTFGGAPRTMTAVRQDLTKNIDLSLFKNFNIKEKAQIQFRAEAFNFSNTPIFSQPNTSCCASNNTAFGIISGQSNGARNVQLALKVLF